MPSSLTGKAICAAAASKNQRYRVSGLNLLVAAVILWKTVYLERAVSALREHGIAIEDESLTHLV